MRTLKLINPIEENLNELIVLEQNQLNISILEKISAVTHSFQKILRTKPEPRAEILKLYHQFLIFKEAIEQHFRKEKKMLLSLSETSLDKVLTADINLNTDLPDFLQQPLKQLKEELTAIVEILADIQETYSVLKNTCEALNGFFKDLENLALFLNVHRNLLKYLFYQKLLQAEKDVQFQLKAS